MEEDKQSERSSIQLNDLSKQYPVYLDIAFLFGKKFLILFTLFGISSCDLHLFPI